MEKVGFNAAFSVRSIFTPAQGRLDRHILHSVTSRTSCALFLNLDAEFSQAIYPRGCKISQASCGGVTHFALTTEEDGGIMTVAYGQNAANGRAFRAFSWLDLIVPRRARPRP